MLSSSSDSEDNMVGKRQRQSTIPMVKREAINILEEFLKQHQESLKAVTPMNSLYQKVSELEVLEEKPNLKRSASYRAASHESLLSNDMECFHSATSKNEEFCFHQIPAPLASDEDCSSVVGTPVSAPETTYNTKDDGSSSSSSGTDSSDSSESNGRHKKSLFKRAKERFTMSFNMSKKNKKARAEKEVKVQSTSQKKKKKTKKKNKGKVISEVTTYIKTHIRQSSTMSDIPSKTEITLRQGDVWESKKIKDKNGESRTVQSHLNIKESSDSTNKKGLSNSFKKIKSLHRNGKKTLSLGRKEANEIPLAQKKIYRRSYSDSDERCIRFIKEESKEDETSTTTKVFNEVIALDKQLEKDNLPVTTSLDRNSLYLNVNPVFTSELPNRGDFEFEAEHKEKVTTIHTPDGLTQRRSSIEHHEHLNDFPDINDIDGADEPDGAYGGVALPDEHGKKIMYKRVANKLADLADEYANSTSDSEGACAQSFQVDRNKLSELNDLEREIVEYILSMQTSSQFPAEAAVAILKHLTYSHFKQIIEAYTKDKNGIQEVVALFFLSKAAIGIVGVGRALASQIKEHTLRYFEDKCAAFIVEQGGWDSVLEDTDEETEGE